MLQACAYWTAMLMHVLTLLLLSKTSAVACTTCVHASMQVCDDMAQVRDYVVQLEAHLAEVHRQSQRLIERQSKLGSSMSDFGASMVALGRFESGTLAQKFTKLGERADTLSGACQVSHTPLPHQVLSPRVVLTPACILTSH